MSLQQPFGLSGAILDRIGAGQTERIEAVQVAPGRQDRGRSQQIAARRGAQEAAVEMPVADADASRQRVTGTGCIGSGRLDDLDGVADLEIEEPATVEGAHLECLLSGEPRAVEVADLLEQGGHAHLFEYAQAVIGAAAVGAEADADARRLAAWILAGAK